MSERKIWWHGCRETNRFWLHLGRYTVAFELGKPQFRLGFEINDDFEHTLAGSFCGFYWHIDAMPIRKLFPVVDGSFGFYWFENGLWFELWGDDNGRYDAPWWRKMFHLDFLDLLLGKETYSKVDIQTFENVVIPMPESTFLARMTFSESIRKRPRWKTQISKWTDISLERAPQFPGKGENSWDCGDDGIYGMSVEGHSLPKAIGGYVEAVMKYRERRGGTERLLLK